MRQTLTETDNDEIGMNVFHDTLELCLDAMGHPLSPSESINYESHMAMKIDGITLVKDAPKVD